MTGNWKTCRRIIGIGLCVVLSVTAAAQLLPPDMLDEESEVEVEVVYRFSVELIVFEYNRNIASGNEIFELKQAPLPFEPEIPVYSDLPENSVISTADNPAMPPDDAIETNIVEDIEIEEIPILADIEFKLMQADELTMGDIHERLLGLDTYQPVLWGGWTQITKELGMPLAIPLRRLGSPPIYMNGSLTLYLKNYLHLAVDLTRELQTSRVQDIDRQPSSGYTGFGSGNTSIFETPDTQTVLYQINEDRIFRNGQLRYYDHPKFGVLARVMRAEAAVPEDDEETLPGPAMLSGNRPN